MLWIIEPHADDAFLSLHSHITELWKGVQKTIVTVYCNPTRTKEAEAYCNDVGCKHLALGYTEGGGLSHESGSLPEFSEWGIVLKKGDRLVFPLGLQHPEHLTVREQIPERAGNLLYLDVPYYSKQKVREELNEKMTGKVINSVVYSRADKWKHIPKFKSQGRYFFHHPPESLPRIEMTVRDLIPAD